MKIILLTLLVVTIFSSQLFFDQQTLIRTINLNTKITWKPGHNKYFDRMTYQQIQKLMGVKETPQQLRLKIAQKEIVSVRSDLPVNFSAIQRWPKCESIREIRDQSNCGSCWAFAAVQAMSDRICIGSGQMVQTRISAEDLLSCCGFVCGSGCNGGYPSAAWSHFKNTGIVTGGLYKTTEWCKPYSLAPCQHHTYGKYQPCSGSAETPKCSRSCIAGYPRTYVEDYNRASAIYSVPNNIQQIQTEIILNGPVQASFEVYEDFLTYTSGVYHYTTGKAVGGHAVKIIGWGVQNGIDYWLVANSWNQDWGDNGFFKIRRGSNQCGIESAIIAGIPIVKPQSQSLLRQ